VALAAVAVLANGTSKAWYGQGIDWAGFVAWGTSSRWQIATLLVAMLLMRRIINRLILPDKRLD
jgi:hypothetical protein